MSAHAQIPVPHLTLRRRQGAHLQDQGDARREESHEDEVIGQYGHAAETAHDL